MKTYTLKKKVDTEEYHLFEGKMVDNNRCTVPSESICQKMQSKGQPESVFACLDEDAARLRCAKIGRKVCGICVSHLYESFD
jgi:hypothetical protein